MISRIDKLRQSFDKSNIDAYIVPTGDEYQNEYTPQSAKRLEYITGFTGSNGYAIITKTGGYFFTDGRYLMQSENEIPDFFEIYDQIKLPEFSLNAIRVGYNPMIFTKNQVNNLLRKLNLVPLSEDLIDEIWENRPASPSSTAYIYGLEYAGVSSADKISYIRRLLEGKADYCLITNPDSICWALNLRAADIEFCPMMLGFLLVSKDKILLFTDTNRISNDVRSQLQFVSFIAEKEIKAYLQAIDNKVMFDPSNCSIGLQNLIKHKIEHVNPCSLPQSCKNPVEIAGAIAGHIKDAVALCESLAWIEAQHKAGNEITEYEVGQKLSYFRALQAGYAMDSFPPIVGFRENGAVIHYRASKDNAKKIAGDGLLLIDSGGHYLGATTDVTRNIVFGPASNEVKTRYTQVLKGHIALANQVFPEGTSGSGLDVLARMFLWQDGLDYAHGTGHGVGNFLSVHEWSMISKYPSFNALKAGMILSNEPGFYKNGEYGIRIENLLYVKDLENGFLKFENLTLVPYCHRLIDFTIINESELYYLTSYYATIKVRIQPYLSEVAKEWLDKELVLIAS